MNFYSLANMSLNSLFDDLAARLRSAEFLSHAAHRGHPGAFTRQRESVQTTQAGTQTTQVHDSETLLTNRVWA